MRAAGAGPKLREDLGPRTNEAESLETERYGDEGNWVGEGAASLLFAMKNLRQERARYRAQMRAEQRHLGPGTAGAVVVDERYSYCESVVGDCMQERPAFFDFERGARRGSVWTPCRRVEVKE